NCCRPKTGLTRSNDLRPAELLPFKHQTKWVPVELPLPTDRDASVFCRQRPILCRVSCKLVQHHCYGLTGLRAQNHLGTADVVVVVRGIGSELLSNEFCQRYPLPSTKTQQLMCCRHRAKAPVQCLNEVGDSV